MRTKLLALIFGIFLAAGTAYAGPANSVLDTDGDTVPDAFDNCNPVTVPASAAINPTQSDLDHDGCGDTCDPPCDFNHNKIVSIGEVTLAINQLGPCPAFPALCPCDLNHNGVCSIGEVTVCINSLGKTVGPSGITNAGCNPVECGCTPAP